MNIGPSIHGIHLGMTLEELKDSAFLLGYTLVYYVNDIHTYEQNYKQEKDIKIVLLEKKTFDGKEIIALVGFRNDRLTCFKILNWREFFNFIDENYTHENFVQDFLEEYNITIDKSDNVNGFYEYKYPNYTIILSKKPAVEHIEIEFHKDANMHF